MWFKKKSYEEGYKNYEQDAENYINSPGKTDTLVKDAKLKAENKKLSLTDVWEKLMLSFDLIGAWRKGHYRDISKGSMLSILAAIIYFISPLDLVPDFIAGFGILDDAAVIAFVLNRVSSELDKFRVWKENSPAVINTESTVQE
ncbi:YkvA family protein [Mesobacillus harenae]|uniref:YkvA family protein n=1 Tax=Mesobacillus harenae TaxID=2213203 RepID=UPI00157FD0DD|nr:YkvA family protein [Mesobacillus harenae]